MDRTKISADLRKAIEGGGAQNAKFQTWIRRRVGGNFASFCLLGVNVNQVKKAHVDILAEIVLEQVVLLSTDNQVEYIWTVVEPGPPENGC